jgi:hypothetical protein
MDEVFEYTIKFIVRVLCSLRRVLWERGNIQIFVYAVAGTVLDLGI